MASTMKAMRIHQWGGPLQAEEIPIPSPWPGEALIRVDACGVGLTVLNYMRGDLGKRPSDLPRIPGHEFVGRVVEVGEGVSSLRRDQRVMAYFYLACDQCPMCLSGLHPLCERLAGLVGVQRDGGYAQYAVLPAANLLPVPDGISDVEATAIPDAIATPSHVCRTRAKVRAGEWVAVIGAAGGVGIHMVQMARLCGGRVLAVDINDEKLAQLPAYGAEKVINFQKATAADVQDMTGGRGLDVVIDLVGRPETVQWGLESLARRGRLILLTTFPDVFVTVSPTLAVLKEIAIIGSRYSSKTEVLQAAELVRDGLIKPVVSDVRPLQEVEAIHEKLRSQTLLGRGCVLPHAGA